MNWYNFKEAINPVNWYYAVKYFIQRGMRGYSDRDTWALDNYISGIIAKGLKQLVKNKHGYSPWRFMTEEENKNDGMNLSEERWKELQKLCDEELLNVAKLFETYYNYWDECWETRLNKELPEYRTYREKLHEKNRAEGKNFFDRTNEDPILEKKQMDLFTKFNNEWVELKAKLGESIKETFQEWGD